MIHQPAVAEHGHEHRNLAGRGTDLHAAALAPIDLHRLGRLVVDFLVDTPARGTDLSAGSGGRRWCCRYSHRGRERSPRGCAPPRVRDTWPAGRRSWPCAGPRGWRGAKTWRAGGWSNLSAAATVCREQWSRREMAQPESFSISARRRISAHKATFMASSFPGWNVAARRPGARSRPVASALGQARTGGAGQAAAGRAPG